MKIDHDYLKTLLLACRASEMPTIHIAELKASNFNYSDPKFEFHMNILVIGPGDDQAWIQRCQHRDLDERVYLKPLEGFLAPVLPGEARPAAIQFG